MAVAAAAAVATHATSRIMRLNTFLFEAGIDNINLIRLQVSLLRPTWTRREEGDGIHG
jgi:hypothetical protein